MGQNNKWQIKSESWQWVYILKKINKKNNISKRKIITQHDISKKKNKTVNSFWLLNLRVIICFTASCSLEWLAHSLVTHVPCCSKMRHLFFFFLFFALIANKLWYWCTDRRHVVPNFFENLLLKIVLPDCVRVCVFFFFFMLQYTVNLGPRHLSNCIVWWIRV